MSFYLDDEGVLRSSLDASNYARGMHTDVAKMRYMASLIETNAEYIMINKAQVELVVKRIIFIYNMLKQLPNPRPTPQILCVMRSVNHLISQMSSNNKTTHFNDKDAMWVELLINHFTCVNVFDALKRRLRSVWSMHSTSNWENEDKEALNHDAQENATLLINLIHPTRHELSSLASLSELWWRARMELKLNPYDNTLLDKITHSGNKEKLYKEETSQKHGKESEEGVFDAEEEHVVTTAIPATITTTAVITDSNESKNTDVEYKNELSDKEHVFASEVSEDTEKTATADEIVSYYKRRALGSWQLPLEQLWRDNTIAEDDDKVKDHNYNIASYPFPHTIEALPGKTIEKIDNAVHTAHSNNLLRFIIEHGWRYHQHHVVVKKLTASSSSTQLQILETLESFVQDAAVRSRWCYPGLVICYGGFTETLAAHTLPANKQKNNSNNNINDLTITYNNEANSNFDAKFAEIDKPTLCLGLIMEDLSVQHRSIDELSEAPLTNEENYSNNNMSDSSSHHSKANNVNITFLSLQELLFVEQHRFTILESITLTLQLADTVQYMLMDDKDVPPSVVKSWTTIALSNVFIACSVKSKHRHRHHRHHHHSKYHKNKPQHDESKQLTSELNLQNEELKLEEQLQQKENREVNDQHYELLEKERQSSSTLFSTSISTSTSEDMSHNSSSNSRLSFHPLRTQFNEFIVKYAPPLHVAHGAVNRWRPHNRATSPPCYALAQFLLALITLRPPFAHVRSQRALRHIALGEDAPNENEGGAVYSTTITTNNNNSNDNVTFSPNSSIESENYESMGLGVRTTVKRTAAIGYTLPSSLPSKLRVFCHEAMSLNRSRKPMSLDELRRQLHDAQEEVKLCRITYLPPSLPSKSTCALQSSSQTSKQDSRAPNAADENNEHGNIEMTLINERQLSECNYVDDYGEM